MSVNQPLNGRLIGPNTPLRLKTAAQLAFPDGSMTASGLRREGEPNRLAIEMIAGKQYTTLSAITEMRQLCRETPKALDSGQKSAAVTSGLSATGQSSAALASALKVAKSLRRKPSKS